MWKRSSAFVSVGPDASGLGSLDLLVADEKQSSTAAFPMVLDDPFDDEALIIASFKHGRF
jgi:hypothetical protein